MQSLRKAFFSLCIVFGLLGMLELIAWIQVRDDIYTGDTGYFWMLKPNLDRHIDNGNHDFHLATNELGLRDASVGDDKTERWLFLGCSTTLGWGVESDEVFLEHLEPILEQKGVQVELINGGQPGWSTSQAIKALSMFQTVSPTRVFIGLGVRDAQLASTADKDAQPSPWIVQRNLFKWLQSMKSKNATVQVMAEPSQQYRVAPEDFRESLKQLKAGFPNAQVVFYRFPQVEYSKKHADVLTDLGALEPTGFTSADFFLDDPIHLTPTGHLKLAEWFAEHFQRQGSGSMVD